MTPLCMLAKKYGADKYRSHNYTPIYYRLLGERAATIERVLEIGIGKGRGLRMWRDFFPAAQIVGVDIDASLLIDEERITSFVADQSNPAEMAAATKQGPFDVIVDDGSHDPRNQVAAMRITLPFLAGNGFYFIEDIRYLVDVIVQAIPVGFRWEAYEGEKRLTAGLRKGRAEVLMAIRHCST